MARKRMIDPSFWEDEKLGNVDPLARLLFMGLISQADDEGRLKGHPSLLRSQIFPYDDEISLQQIDKWLGLLGNLIQRYEIDAQKYIWVRNFKKHQTINKPQESKLPGPPDDYGSTTVVIPEEDGSVPDQKKLIEEKLKEEEVKGKGNEGTTASTYNDHVKDQLHELILKCKIKSYNLVSADDIFFFIGKLDIEVIEMAIKKAFEKHLNYAINTLTDWLKEGKVKVEDHKPKVGDPNEKSIRSERNDGTDKPVTGPVGWLPGKYNKDNVVQMPNVSG